jgi:hypothetical protein
MVRVSKAKLWKAIRGNCVECFGGHRISVKDCSSPKCHLFPYRMGKTGLLGMDDEETGPERQAGDRKVVKRQDFWKK